MNGYGYPVGDIYVPSDWADHKKRRPPSTEPGTDYACPAGTPVYAPADGFVVGIDRNPAGPPGRSMMIRTGDDYHRGNHLLRIDVISGQRFRRGQQLALSGGSANGSEHGVGDHLHWSFWRKPGRVPMPGITPTQDFELYLEADAPAGGGEQPFPTPQPDTTPILREDAMDQTAVIRDESAERWALIGATVPSLKGSKPGAWVTKDPFVANAWAVVHGNGIFRKTTQFEIDIAEAQKLAAAWLAQQKTIAAS